MENYIPHDQSFITELAAVLRQEYSTDEIQAMQDKYLEDPWPSTYVNSETGRIYEPHHKLEELFVYSDGPKHFLVKGGEGGGKSVSGIIKDLNRLKRGCSGVMTSPDLEHFKKSLWPEFNRWCPWDRVIDRHQFMREPGWMPREYFEIVFRNGIGTYSTLGCGGCPESDIMKWEGPNINFVHMDEMRRHKSAAAIKVFTGRVRITGPGGVPPQIYLTTTPLKHWMYEYFGPMTCTCQDCHAGFEWDLAPNTKPICPNCQSPNFRTSDKWQDFKLDAAVITLRTQDNEPNLYNGFAKDRALSLSEAEARVLLDAEWEDLADTEHFLPSMTMWDLCRSDDIPPLSPNDPLVIGVDAAKGRTNDYSDCFAIVAVSRHWDKAKRRDHVVVRYVQTWQAKSGRSIQLVADKSRNQPDGPEDVLARLIKDYNVVQVAYDPYQMADLGQRFKQKRMAWMKEFGQISERTEADSDLLQLIMSRRIVHNGDATLREHIENADRKVSDDGNKIRIVKRLDSLKVDAAVALSMACKRCLYLNIGNLSIEDRT